MWRQPFLSATSSYASDHVGFRVGAWPTYNLNSSSHFSSCSFFFIIFSASSGPISLATPSRPVKLSLNRLNQTTVLVGDHKVYSPKPSSFEPRQEVIPTAVSLAVANPKPQHLALSPHVHPYGDECALWPHLSAFPYLKHHPPSKLGSRPARSFEIGRKVQVKTSRPVPEALTTTTGQHGWS